MAILLKNQYKIPAGSTTTISIPGEPVNYFRIQNGGNTNLYCGLMHMPTEDSYEFRVPAGASRMYCEEKCYNYIYVLNNSTEDANIILYTFRAPFNPTVLAMTDFADEDSQAGQVNVEITGFTEPLPSGGNTIGNVGVNNLIDYNTILANILSAVKSITGTSGGGGGASTSPETYAKMVETTATSTPVEYTATAGRIVSEIALLSNDGESTLSITVIEPDGTEQGITLKSGEVLDNVKVWAQKLEIAGGGSYRLIYNETVVA